MFARLVLLLPLLVLACATQTNAPSRPGPPAWEPIPTDAIEGHFSTRLRIEYEHGEMLGHFLGVLQKRCDEVELVITTRAETRIYTVRQKGRDVEVETHMAGAWPFSARQIYDDLQRTFFLPFPTEPLADGEHEFSHPAELRTERWSEGRLVERSFRPTSGAPPGRIRISFADGIARDDPVRDADLDNDWLDYEFEFEILEHSALTCP